MDKHEIEIVGETVIDTFKSVGDEFVSVLLGPLSGAKNALKTLYSGVKEYSFNTFLKYFYNQLEEENLSKKDIEKFNKKLKSKKSRIYLANILDSLYFSRSITTIKILAMITAKYATNDNFDYCDLVLISALKDIYDEDILKIVHFYNKPSKDSVVGISGYSIEDRISLEKLQNLNIFGRDRITGRFADKENKPLFYEKTEVSTRFMEYYCKIRKTYGDKLN